MTNVELPQSVKVREAYVEGDVKGIPVTIELPHSVKVREGLREELREGLMRVMIFPQSVKVREGYVKSDVKVFLYIRLLGNRRDWLGYRHW